MNSNRTRYASTPTYGMQKRSKKPVSPRPVPQTPDFSQAPDPLTGMPMPPQQSVIPPANMQSFSYFPPTVSMPQPPFFQASPPAPPQPSYPSSSMMTSGIPAAPFQPSYQPIMPPPISAMTQAAQPVAGTFSGRTQGFVPPQMPQSAAPTVQSANPLQAPFAPTQQTIPPFAAMQPPPVYSYPSAQQPVAQPVTPAQNVATPAAPKAEPKPLDVDKLWGVFLFGLLPLLLIPSLLAGGMWSWIRYVFIGAAVIGLGGMWYRQMYSSTARIIISAAYVALCVASIAMLMQGTNDLQQTSALSNPSDAAQQSVWTEGSAAPSASMTPAPEITATPAPMSGPSAAETRLTLFMECWKENKTNEMVYLVQPSWCSQQADPAMALFTVLANRTPEDFTIEEISGTDTDNSRTITMRATINKNTGKAPSIFRFMVMMVREGDEWYVNPNSLATNDEQKQASTDENVVTTQDTGTVTEPPRTTVTPAPPANTTLYYNVGANYYHMDPNCSTVKAEYLPFDMSFSYSDLKAVRSANGLSPCLMCDAPTNTLEEAGE